MDIENYYSLTIRCSGQRTPHSKHSIDYYPYVSGDESLKFSTLDEVKKFLIERYGKIPTSPHKMRDGKGNVIGIDYRRWVVESPNIYNINVLPIKFYKCDSIYIEQIIHMSEVINL